MTIRIEVKPVDEGGFGLFVNDTQIGKSKDQVTADFHKNFLTELIEEALVDAKESGYDEADCDTSYDDGYESGRSNGYDDGYSDGLGDGRGECPEKDED